jgi:uncharacterized DUF497 family protein
MYTKMEFEYDPQKSKLNKDKHGIDFEEAQRLWDDPDCIGFPGRLDDEDRFALLAMYKGKLWVAFFTYRNNRIRIISTRRARTKERSLYES